MPQPMGPYQELLFAPDGQESHAVNADDDSYAVIEVGQYTTDFALLLHGHTIENAFGSCDGMRIAAEHLQRSLRQSQIAVSMAEATDLLRTKTLRNFGARIDVSEQVVRAVEPLATQIVDKANQLIGKNQPTHRATRPHAPRQSVHRCWVTARRLRRKTSLQHPTHPRPDSAKLRDACSISNPSILS